MLHEKRAFTKDRGHAIETIWLKNLLHLGLRVKFLIHFSLSFLLSQIFILSKLIDVIFGKNGVLPDVHNLICIFFSLTEKKVEARMSFK